MVANKQEDKSEVRQEGEKSKMEVTVFCNRITEVTSYAVFCLFRGSHWVQPMLKGRELHRGREDQEGRAHWELFQKLPNSLNHSSIYGASTMYKALGWK